MSRLQDRYKIALFLVGGLLLGSLLGIYVFVNGPASSAGRTRSLPPTVGSAVPDFELQTKDGEIVRLSGLKGRAVVINFWATWCEPCREEMPLFLQYARKEEERLTFLGVNEQEGLEVVKNFTERYEIDLPILFDFDGGVADRYFVRSFPSTFFVDSDGILRAQHLGQLDEKLLVKYLETIGIVP